MLSANSFSQIYSNEIIPGLIQIYIRQNNFLSGEIDIKKKIFYSIPRSTKNLFHLFHGVEGGLGLNEEILLRTDYDKIKVKFNDKILTTTRIKWLNAGIVSPYCNQMVDKQIILRLSEINMCESEKYRLEEIQTNLFEAII